MSVSLALLVWCPFLGVSFIRGCSTCTVPPVFPVGGVCEEHDPGSDRSEGDGRTPQQRSRRGGQGRSHLSQEHHH